MHDTLHDYSHDEITHTGNAPLIPRRELVDILNQLQMLTTKVIVILNRYEPDHFNGKQDEKEVPVSPV